jgi:AcrR family transcriptional regulator
MNDSPKRERILTSAGRVFLKYGFKRATMGRIAKVAQVSRPAVYLIFPSKEEAFNAVLEGILRRMLDDIHRGINGFTDTRGKLLFAFEVWYVHPVQLAQISPHAKDLYDTHYEFAEEVTTMALSVLARLVADLLEPAVRKQTRVKLSSDQVAEVLMGAIAGFKNMAKTTKELRRLTGNLLTVVLASLQEGESPVHSARAVDTAAAVADVPPRSEPHES